MMNIILQKEEELMLQTLLNMKDDLDNQLKTQQYMAIAVGEYKGLKLSMIADRYTGDKNYLYDYSDFEFRVNKDIHHIGDIDYNVIHECEDILKDYIR